MRQFLLSMYRNWKHLQHLGDKPVGGRDRYLDCTNWGEHLSNYGCCHPMDVTLDGINKEKQLGLQHSLPSASCCGTVSPTASRP